MDIGMTIIKNDIKLYITMINDMDVIMGIHVNKFILTQEIQRVFPSDFRRKLTNH